MITTASGHGWCHHLGDINAAYLDRLPVIIQDFCDVMLHRTIGLQYRARIPVGEMDSSQMGTTRSARNGAGQIGRYRLYRKVPGQVGRCQSRLEGVCSVGLGLY